MRMMKYVSGALLALAVTQLSATEHLDRVLIARSEVPAGTFVDSSPAVPDADSLEAALNGKLGGFRGFLAIRRFRESWNSFLTAYHLVPTPGVTPSERFINNCTTPERLEHYLQEVSGRLMRIERRPSRLATTLDGLMVDLHLTRDETLEDFFRENVCGH